MNKIILVALGVVVGVGLVVFIYLNTNQNLSQNWSGTNSKPESVIIENFLAETSEPGISRYSFEGDVKTVTADEDQNPKIIFENGNNLTVPDFILISTTHISKQSGEEFKWARLSDVKVGSHIILHIKKDDQLGFGAVRDVYILE